MQPKHVGLFVTNVDYAALIKQQASTIERISVPVNANFKQTLKGGRQKQMSLGTRRQHL